MNRKMDSKVSRTKLTGIVKSYRKKTAITSQYLKPHHLTMMNVQKENIDLCDNKNSKMAVESLTKIGKTGTITKRTMGTSRPLPPAIIPITKPEVTTLQNLNPPQRTKPKLSKWDFKGRLAWTQEELVICKTNLKNAASLGNELADELSELLEQEKSSKERAEEAEKLYNKLVDERDTLVNKKENSEAAASKLKENVDKLSSELNETLDRLNEFKNNYENHDSKMSELLINIEKVKEENCAQKNITNSLKNHNIELQVAIDDIQEKRTELLNVIRLLKGDD